MEEKNDRDEMFLRFILEVLNDRKRESRFWKLLYLVATFLLAVLIGCMVWLGIYNQERINSLAERSEKRMYEFLAQYEFTGDIDINTENNDNNSGNVNVTK